MLFDAHIHLDFYNNIDETIESLNKVDLKAFFATHLPELYLSYLKKSKIGQNSHIILALGYHPEIINDYPFDKKQFHQALETAQVIGEVGLDYLTVKTDDKKILQKNIFNYICQHCGDRVLTVHSRKAESDVLECLHKWNVRRAIFHWYTGKLTLIPDILNSGYYFSVNPMMISSVNGKKVLEKLPLNRIFIESDGPFSKIEGKVVEPENFIKVYDAFAKFFGVSCSFLQAQIRENYNIFFNYLFGSNTIPKIESETTTSLLAKRMAILKSHYRSKEYSTHTVKA